MKKNGRNGIEYHSERNKVELDFYGLSPCCPLLHKVKREASRVVGNIAHLFSDDLETAIHSLMENTKNDGTVIRWGSA